MKKDKQRIDIRQEEKEGFVEFNGYLDKMKIIMVSYDKEVKKLYTEVFPKYPTEFEEFLLYLRCYQMTAFEAKKYYYGITNKLKENTCVHSSYGLISLSRIEHGGQGKHVFASKIRHGVTFEMRIYPAFVETTVGREVFSALLSPLLVLELSPIQLLELFSSMNTISSFFKSSEIPCTIKAIDNITIEEPPVLESTIMRTKKEFKQKAELVNTKLSILYKKLRELLKQPRISKKELKNYILRDIEAIIREFTCNMPYIEEQFQEDILKMTTESKIEIDETMTQVVTRLGIEQSNKVQLPKETEG